MELWNHFITSSSISDFEVDGKTFEIGEKNKSKRQLTEASDGYVVKDDIEYPYLRTLPLWTFGFLY